MHKFITAVFLLLGTLAHSQIKGKVTASNGEPIPFVSITIENTYTGTTANEEGSYELPLRATGKYTMVFQSIGYKTKKIPVNIASFPHTLDVVLQDESYELNAVSVSNTEDPAYAIIRQAIAHKKENSEKTGRFEADFYSKGII
ncbi:MAG TPA: carboxypeptidase-like regulatory domain-containing protein, partial [Flavobacterium sp.]|nr:carboxypeptidase-like regulatory domain-containing protein [Flavobacterium sp.]